MPSVLKRELIGGELVRESEKRLAEKREPLLKWPGGKRRLVEDILIHIPGTFRRYYEPFVGGGAMFFALDPNRATLSDTNEQLINCYRMVRDEPDRLMKALAKLRNTADHYYEVRDWSPSGAVEQAARLLYLTRLSFNGIHRVNRVGEFNVPYGGRSHLNVFNEGALLQCSAALQKARLTVSDFQIATSEASEGDLVYLDPPYTVAHAMNGFVRYNEKIFSWSDQVRLASVARELGERGCTVIVSNADHPSVRALYPSIEPQILRRYSLIAASTKHRREITESLYVLGPKPRRQTMTKLYPKTGTRGWV